MRRYIDRFDCSAERGTRHVLTTNYRSNRSIYAVAEAVLDADERLKQRGDIRTSDAGTQPVQLVACDDPEAERTHVLRQLRDWLDDGAERSDLAVLTRWNRRLAALERACLRAGLACETSQSEALLDTPPAQKLHALLRVVDARRRGRPLDAPMTELLSHLLPDDTMARLRDFGERSMPDATLWTAFQTVVSNEQARRSAGLDSATDRLDQTYATITNLLQNTQEDGLTIGAFTRTALRQLGDPLQLLRRYADTLTDPASRPSVRQAGTVLDEWRRAQARDARAGDPPRLLLHHRTPQITRLWRQLVRRALDLETDPPAPLPEMQEALFARPADEGIPPLGADDVVLTNDLEALLRWAERTGAFSGSTDTPQILLLAPDGALPSGQKTLLGVDPDDVHVVDPESTFHSPSVRLVKLLQMTSGPSAPEPLFPEYVMVDLEATSTDPRHCRVAEIGALKVRDGTVVDRFSELVQLPEDLTADERETLRTVCGLDPASDFDEARPEAAVWADFCAFTGRPSSPTTASATTSASCAASPTPTRPTPAGPRRTTCCPPRTSCFPTFAATTPRTSARRSWTTTRIPPIAPWPTVRISSASWRACRRSARAGAVVWPTSRSCRSSWPPSRTNPPPPRPCRTTPGSFCRWGIRGPCATPPPPVTTCARSCPGPCRIASASTRSTR
nr:3'-5' exonuclease [Salinibacter ruber]